jgi:hypothetical protein
MQKLLVFNSNIFLSNITAIDKIMTPEYIEIEFTTYPTFVIGFKSPKPSVDIVIKVSQIEF